MRVRLDTSLVWYGREYHHGEEIDLPDAVAKRYIATRQAELVEPLPAPATHAAEATMKDNATQQTTMRKHSPQLRRR
jgi:hypothetical protein